MNKYRDLELSEERLTELSELQKQPGVMTNWAYKVHKNPQLELSQDEKDLCVIADKIAIGVADGVVSSVELSAFIKRSLQPEYENAPDEILDMMFDRGNIGEFDSYQVYEEPVNRLNAIEAGHFGDVEKSYIDYRKLVPITKNLEISTQTTEAKLRKGGYKTVAELIVMGEESLKNKMFSMMFSAADSSVTKTITSAPGLTLTAMDEASTYLMNYGDNPMMLGLSTVLSKANRLSGYSDYMTNDMKDQINKYGILQMHNGVRLVPFKDSRKLADDTTIFPAGKILGIGGKIGWLDMRGSLSVRTAYDSQHPEKINIKMGGYSFTYCITKPEKICKITVS